MYQHIVEPNLWLVFVTGANSSQRAKKYKRNWPVYTRHQNILEWWSHERVDRKTYTSSTCANTVINQSLSL